MAAESGEVHVTKFFVLTGPLIQKLSGFTPHAGRDGMYARIEGFARGDS